MTVSVVISQPMADDIEAVASRADETAGVMLASVVNSPNGDIRLLARGMRWVNDSAYAVRDWNRMSIRSEGYIRALAEAETLRASAIWVHTHPGNDAWPVKSDPDHVVDSEIAELFRIRAGSAYYGSLIFSSHSSGLAFTGHLHPENSDPIQVSRLWQVGDQWRLYRAFDSPSPQLPPIFDRNVRAFGPAIQQTLGDLRVAVIGCGGTGSAVAEQLVRLGVRHLLLMDPDCLAASNVTRVYGSTSVDTGQPKVEVVARHLLRIAPDLKCDTVQSMVTMESAARKLTSSDIIFGCTDDNAGRLVLSRCATYLMTPLIDCGVLLSSDSSGKLRGIDGRVTIISPGEACLICRNRINLPRASAELLTPDERVRRQNEGYAPALAGVEPAVVTFTTLVAATAVSELLERLIGYGPRPRPGEVLLRCHEREISTNIALARPGHYCHPASSKIGLGITEPFLEQTWPTA
jgi:molybdopterin/thiamine biosynthesis adenylyltransferase